MTRGPQLSTTARTWTRRRALRFAGTVGATGVLGAGAACGPAGSGAPAGGAAEGPAAVQWWDQEPPAFKQFVDTWLPQFTAKHPKINVEFSPRPPQWQEKLTAAMVAGTPPDVVAVFGDWFRTYQQQKQVIGLDGYLKASRFDSHDFIQGQWKGMTWGGQQVAIPQYINPNVIFYNREHFQKAGVAFPKDDWTWDHLVEAARKVMRGSPPRPDVWGFTSSFGGIAKYTCSVIWAQCGDFNDPKDPNVFTFTRPENVKAFQWAHDLLWKQQFSAKTNAELGGVDARNAMFATGAVAISLDAALALQTWRDRGQTDWDLAALPRGPCGRGERIAMDGYVITSGSKVPDAAWTFVQAVTDKEANKLRGDIALIMPSRKSQFDAYVKAFPGRNVKAALPTDAARPDPLALWPKSTDVNRAISPIFASLYDRNEISVPDALKQAQEAVVGVLGPSAGK
jgi:multiple sugar transport system substrate-binding protein